MVHREIPVEDGNDKKPNLLGEIFTSGNIATMVVSLLMVGMSWGGQLQWRDAAERRIDALENRDMTPGAAAAVGEIRVFDRSLELRVTNLEAEMRQQRLEMMGYLQRIQEMVQVHMTTDRDKH